MRNGSGQVSLPPFLVFRGRANRVRYTLVLTSIYLVLQVASLHPGFLVLAILAGGAAYACVVVQRVHDLGLSGWFGLIASLPGINFLLLAIPGTAGANRHGAPASKPTRKELIATICTSALTLAGFAVTYYVVVVPAWERYRAAGGL